MPDQAPSPSPTTAPALTQQPTQKPVQQLPGTTTKQPSKPAQTLGADVKPPTTEPTILRKYKVKIDGQESEVDEQELVRGYQIRKAADKKFEEAAMTRKQSEDFLSKLKDPKGLIGALQELGYDPRQLAEAYLSNELNYELMTPEQKEAYQYKMEVQRYREAEAARKEDEDKKQNMTLTERQAMDLQGKIINILDTENLPKKPSTVWRIARQMLINLDNGMDVDPKDVVYDVAREIKQEHQDLYGDLSGEQLLQLLGPDIAKKIRMHDISQVANPIKGTRSPQSFSQPKPAGRKFISEKDFDAHLRKIKESGR